MLEVTLTVARLKCAKKKTKKYIFFSPKIVSREKLN